MVFIYIDKEIGQVRRTNELPCNCFRCSNLQPIWNEILTGGKYWDGAKCCVPGGEPAPALGIPVDI